MNKWNRIAAVVLAAFAAWGAATHAQAPTARKVYTNKKAFKLPLQVDDRERGKLQTIQLFVKTKANMPWTLHDSIAPHHREFVYHAPQDGEYWFTLVTVDKLGRATPPDVAMEQPGLIVVVDQEAPVVEVHPYALGAGQPCLQCNVRDANPDPSRTKLEYQAADRSWQPLEAIPDQPGCFRVTDPAVFSGTVRATAADRAGNVMLCELNLLQNKAVQPVRHEPVQPVVLESTPPNILDSRPVPVPPEIRPATNEPRTIPLPHETQPTPMATEVRTEKITQPPSQPALGSRQFLNTTQATLKYQIDKLGPSGIGRVEVYVTRNDGQTWQRLGEDTGRQSAIAVNLPGEGTFGVRIVATNGNGLGGEPPLNGDPPDYRIEVDTTKPVAQLMSARVGSGTDAGSLVVQWSASDQNLRPEPIDLWYSSRPEGPWTPIVKGWKNDGSYRWLLPRETSDEMYIRMEATDLAGNCTAAQTQQPVVIDRTRLKAHIIGIVGGNGDR